MFGLPAFVDGANDLVIPVNTMAETGRRTTYTMGEYSPMRIGDARVGRCSPAGAGAYVAAPRAPRLPMAMHS